MSHILWGRRIISLNKIQTVTLSDDDAYVVIVWENGRDNQYSDRDNLKVRGLFTDIAVKMQQEAENG